MHDLPRRTFLKTAVCAIGAGALTPLRPSAWARPEGANGDVRIGVIGFNRKGSWHIRQLLETPGARVVALCDVDPRVLAREVENLRSKQRQVFATTDARALLDRPDVDAVVIATGNHWHALLTIWACQAGKDVYVEKPVSRTLWEGSKMVEAAARYGRMVQTGTQFRSDAGIAEAVAWVREGHLGTVQAVHTQCFKLRDFIGRRQPWYPEEVDYHLFCGSTPVVPLERNELHYDWHWSWHTGNGELGNNGVHVLDIARRFAGHDTAPARVLSLGGRFVHRDAAETPNTQLTVFDYGSGAPLYFESRGLPAKPGVRYMDSFQGIREGVVVHCEGGYFAGYTGGSARDHQGKVIRKFEGDGGSGHMANFLATVRSRKAADLAAPITTGHLSTALCHLGNISFRLGAPVLPEKIRLSLGKFGHGVETLKRITQHLAAHGVDADSEQLSLGPWVSLGTTLGDISAVENGDETQLARARYLLQEAQRPPFVIPEVL